jgi:transcriptional regulator with XRE-family HTH domain
VLEIGSSLREARQRRGLEVSEAAEATMIRARYLEALESERFEVLPEGPYLRSFLREYAEYLGLDGDILVTEWMLRFAPARPEPPEPPRRISSASFLSDPRRRHGLLVFLALVAAAVAVWQLGGSSPTTLRSAAPPVETSKPIAPIAHVPKVHTAARKPHPMLVLAAARGPCWLLVRIGSAAGSVVTERTLRQGETVRFGLRRPLWIRLGAPWNVDVVIGRRSVDASLPAAPGNVLVAASGVRSA